MILKQAIDTDLIDRFVTQLESLPYSFPPGLLMTGYTPHQEVLYDPAKITPRHSIRIVDYYYFSDLARQLLFHQSITDFLDLIFEKSPTLTQSLSFKFGSQQAVHQNTAFVINNSPQKLAASWIALEDVEPGTGELVYYPGSHHWDDFKFSSHFKHYDEERDGVEQIQQWQDWMRQQADSRETELQAFLPKKGDVLIWHASLAHGGAVIEQPDRTRKSLVGHYCPTGVRPLYHYYKPAQRRLYPYRSFQYSTAYYGADES